MALPTAVTKAEMAKPTEEEKQEKFKESLVNHLNKKIRNSFQINDTELFSIQEDLRFGLTEAAVAEVITHFENAGWTVERVEGIYLRFS